MPHRLHNPGDAPVRVLAVATPAGFEHHLRAIAVQDVPGELPGPQHLARIGAIGARFRIEFAAP